MLIGSGICGSSIAYHLAKRGWTDVVLLEQGPLISGTTSHAPGLVGQLRANASLVALLKESVALYRNLMVDGERGFFQVGSLRIASSRERMRELERQHAHAASVGLETSLITAREAHELFPLMDPAGVESALLLRTDGSAKAPLLAEAMRRSAEAVGVKTFDRTRLTGIDVAGGHVRGVHTERGSIEAEVVISAAGIWSPRIGAMAGVSIPLRPMQHQVVWTGPLSELAVDRPLPNLRDPDNLVYFRQDGQGLAVGGYELDPRGLDVVAIPDNDHPTIGEYDATQFEPLMRGACQRVPSLRDAPLAKRLNGIESFTPDGEFILGEAPEVGGFWVACGFCAHGVSGSGGVGKAMADWIVDGQPPIDLSSMDISRFGGQVMTSSELKARTDAIYRDYYSKIVS